MIVRNEKGRNTRNAFQQLTSRGVHGRHSRLKTILLALLCSALLSASAQNCFDSTAIYPIVIGDDSSAAKGANEDVKNVWVDATPNMIIYAFDSKDNSVNTDDRLHFIRVDPSDGSEVWHKGYDDSLAISRADTYSLWLTIDKATETYFYVSFERSGFQWIAAIRTSDAQSHSVATAFQVAVESKVFFYGDNAAALQYVFAYNNYNYGSGAIRISTYAHQATVTSNVSIVQTGAFYNGQWLDCLGAGIVKENFIAAFTVDGGTFQQITSGETALAADYTWSFHTNQAADGMTGCGRHTLQSFKADSGKPRFYIGMQSDDGLTICASVFFKNTPGANTMPDSNTVYKFTGTTVWQTLDVYGSGDDDDVSFFLWDDALKQGAILRFMAGSNTMVLKRLGFIKGNGKIQDARLTGHNAGFYSGYMDDGGNINRFDTGYGDYLSLWPVPWEHETDPLKSKQGFVNSIDSASTCAPESSTVVTGTIISRAITIIAGLVPATTFSPNDGQSIPLTDSNGNRWDQNMSKRTTYAKREWCRTQTTAVTITADIQDQGWIDGDAFEYQFDSWFITPACNDFEIAYAIVKQVKNGVTEQAVSFTVDDDTRKIEHAVDATAVVGDFWLLTFYGLLPDGQSKTIVFRVTYIAACSTSFVSVQSPFADHTYYLGSGAVNIQTVFTQTITDQNCAIDHKLEIKLSTSSAWVDYATNTASYPWITSFDTTDGTIVVNSSVTALDGLDYKFRITASNPTNPTFIATDDIEIELRDICRNANLVQAVDRNDFNNRFTLWDDNNLPFIGAQYDMTSCPIRYELREYLVVGNPIVTFAGQGSYSFDTTSYSVPKLAYRATDDSWDDGNWRYYLIKATLTTSSGAVDIESTEVQIAVYYDNPCKDGSTAINSQTIADLVVDIFDNPGDTSTYAAYSDSVTTTYGVGAETNLCGAYWYQIVDANYNAVGAPLALNIGSRTITLRTDTQSDYTNGQFVTYYLKVWFKNYPETDTVLYNPFRIKVDTCFITALTPTPIAVTDYNVYTPAVTITVADFVQTPLCGYVLDYKVEVLAADWNPTAQDISAFPSVFQVTYNANVPETITVYSTTVTDVKSYHIRITASVKLTDMNPTFTDYQDIIVNVDHDCLNDEVAVTSSHPATLLHYINYNGPQTYNPVWTTLVPGCPVEYHVVRVVNGVETPITAAPVTHNDPMTQWTVESNDFGLDGEVWDIRIIKKSTYSVHTLQRAVIDMEVTFRDRCWDAILSAPTLRNDVAGDFIFDIGQQQKMTYNAMTSTISCNGFHYELVYVAGPLAPSPSLAHYSSTCADDPCFGGTVSDVTWYGTHTFKIVGTLGIYDVSNSRGVNGLYNSVEVQFDVSIVNPCDFSILTPTAVSDISTSVHGGESQYSAWREFTDSASTRYGNGFDLCGAREYYVTDENDVRISFDFMSWRLLYLLAPLDIPEVNTLISNYAGVTEPVHTFLVDPITDPQYAGIYNLRLHGYLVEYPSATHGIAPFVLEVKDCQLTKFQAPELQVQQYVVGEKPKLIRFALEQSPCMFEFDFEVLGVNDRTGLTYKLPSFITEVRGKSAISVDTHDDADAGQYLLQVTGTLDNDLKTSVTFMFELIVYGPEVTFILKGNTDPYFSPAPSNQLAVVGEAFNYTLGVPLDDEGDRVSVQIDLGTTPGIVGFISDTNSFIIQANKTTHLDSGFYNITLTLQDDNPDRPANVTYSFFLEIGTPPGPPPPAGPPPIILNGSEWNIIDAKPEKDKAAPIPYIIDFSYSGLLTIGFDRKMKPPTNQTAVVNEKLAVRGLREKANFTVDDEVVEMTIVPVLEFTVDPGDDSDPEKLGFEWQLLNFTDNFLWIQIYFDDPQLISANRNLDSITVQFWGSEYFESEDGVQIRSGTKLSKKLMRQISPALAEGFGRLMRLTNALLKISCVLFFFFSVCTFGSLLPFWAFINSLQLIVHTVLIGSLMPANVAFVFSNLLDFSRFNLLPITESMRDGWGFNISDVRAHNENFEEFGYNSIYLIPNLGFLFLLSMIATLVLIVAAIKDVLVLKSGLFATCPTVQARSLPAVVNACVRLLYETYLILCICVFINLANWRDSRSYVLGDLSIISDPITAGIVFSKIFTIISLLIMVAFLLYVESFFWSQKFYLTKLVAPFKYAIAFTMKDAAASVEADAKNEGKKKSKGDFDKIGSSGQNFDSEQPRPDETMINDANNHSRIGLKSRDISAVDLTQIDQFNPDEKESQSKVDLRPRMMTPLGAVFAGTPSMNHLTAKHPQTQNGKVAIDVLNESNELDQQHVTVSDKAAQQNNFGTMEDHHTHGTNETFGGDQKGWNRSQGVKVQDQDQEKDPYQEDSDEDYRAHKAMFNKIYAKHGKKKPAPAAEISLNTDPRDYEGNDEINIPEQQYSQPRQAPSGYDVTLNKKILLDFEEHEMMEGGEVDMFEGGAEEDIDPEVWKELKAVAKTQIEREEMYVPHRYIRTLFDGLKLGDPNQIALVHILMFLARRFVLALILVTMTEHPLGQVTIYLLSSIFMLWLLHMKKQWGDKYMLWLQIFNEWCVFATGVQMYLFLEIVPLADTRYSIGIFLIIQTYVFIIVNHVAMWYMAFRVFSGHQVRSERLDKVRERELFNEKAAKVKAKLRGSSKGFRKYTPAVKVVKSLAAYEAQREQEKALTEGAKSENDKNSKDEKPFQTGTTAYRKVMATSSIQTDYVRTVPPKGEVVNTSQKLLTTEQEVSPDKGKMKSNQFVQDYTNRQRELRMKEKAIELEERKLRVAERHRQLADAVSENDEEEESGNRESDTTGLDPSTKLHSENQQYNKGGHGRSSSRKERDDFEEMKVQNHLGGTGSRPTSEQGPDSGNKPRGILRNTGRATSLYNQASRNDLEQMGGNASSGQESTQIQEIRLNLVAVENKVDVNASPVPFNRKASQNAPYENANFNATGGSLTGTRQRGHAKNESLLMTAGSDVIKSGRGESIEVVGEGPPNPYDQYEGKAVANTLLTVKEAPQRPLLVEEELRKMSQESEQKDASFENSLSLLKVQKEAKVAKEDGSKFSIERELAKAEQYLLQDPSVDKQMHLAFHGL